LCTIHGKAIYVVKGIAASTPAHPPGQAPDPAAPRFFPPPAHPPDVRMSLKVFVSSTRNDLDKDCRPQVIKAVTTAQGAPMVMETWPADYAPALEQVKQKIDESTHYVGLFAYRRGWTPPGSPVSITEAEFDHACARHQGRIAVFVPEEGSEIAAVLMGYAVAAQDEADTDAQIRFLKRVLGEGTVEAFEDVPDLARRATRCVLLWNESLLEMQLERTRGAGSAPRADEIAELGRKPQMDCFEADVLDRLAGAGGTSAVAALVWGAAGNGHAQLLARLRAEFDAVSRRMQAYTIGCGPLWRTGSLNSLLRVLARETRVAELASVSAAAAHLGALLAQKDVVLEVTRLQNFDNGVAGFVEQFWAPLVDALPAGTAYSLLCLGSHEGAAPAPPAWDAAVQPCGGEPFDPRRMVRLPGLEPFTPAELSRFLRSRVEPDQVAPLVQAVMDTTGGSPALVYQTLAEPDFWTQ
jgi:hypothetical protein